MGERSESTGKDNVIAKVKIPTQVYRRVLRIDVNTTKFFKHQHT
jgi:hypothetical protein